MAPKGAYFDSSNLGLGAIAGGQNTRTIPLCIVQNSGSETVNRNSDKLDGDGILES